MAKSKDITSLSTFTRRKVLVAGALAPLMPIITSPPPWVSNQADRDPILALGQEWHRLHTESEDWLATWQKLEVFLFRTVGFPRVAVPDPSCEGAPTYVTEHADIDELLGKSSGNRGLRKRLHAELSAQQARWDAAAAAVEFDAVEARHEVAQEKAGALMEEIFTTPAASLTGLAAKLALISKMGEEREGDDSEFPWPEIRGVLADLHRLTNALG